VNSDASFEQHHEALHDLRPDGEAGRPMDAEAEVLVQANCRWFSSPHLEMDAPRGASPGSSEIP
jgi:hypothetical protein